MNGLMQLLPKDISSNPAQWGPYALALGIGMALGWGIDAIKKSNEIRKLRAERDMLAAEKIKLEAEEVRLLGETLKEVQRARDLHTEACARISELAAHLIELVKAEEVLDRVKPVREEFCAVLCDQVITRYCSFAEWQILSRKRNEDDILDYIGSEVIPELHRIAHWVGIVNLPLFLDHYRLKRLTIESRTMSPFRELLRYLSDEHRMGIKASLNAAISMVCNR